MTRAAIDPSKKTLQESGKHCGEILRGNRRGTGVRCGRAAAIPLGTAAIPPAHCRSARTPTTRLSEGSPQGWN
jgi:hypothetical protein